MLAYLQHDFVTSPLISSGYAIRPFLTAGHKNGIGAIDQDGPVLG